MRKMLLTLAALTLLVSCRRGTVTINDSEGEIIGSQVIQQVTPGKVIVDPMHGTQAGFQYGAVSGVGETKANGVAYQHEFEDASFVHSLTVNIQKAPSGKVYVGWVTREDGSDPVKLGELLNPFGDVRHGVKLDTKTNLREHSKVIVTLESSMTVTKPGTIVARGTMKRVK